MFSSILRAAGRILRGRLVLSLTLLTLPFLVALPAQAVVVTGVKKVVVLRVYFQDYSNTSRYTQAQVQGFFNNMNTLWGTNTSHGNISITAQANSALIQLPDNRSSYIDDFPDGDLSNGTKFQKVIDDAIANSSGMDWTNVDAVIVVMSETSLTQFHRGQGGTCNARMGPGSSATPLVGCAIFSENPGSTDPQVWGRWSHELGHAFQTRGAIHPSNYNSSFEQMDANYPGQTGMFEQQSSTDFGWMPDSKYKTITAITGGATVALYAQEYDPAGKPNMQAIKAYLGSGGSAYYLISVRRRVLGDDLNASFPSAGIPDEGVLIERVVPGGDQEVTLQGKGGDRDKLWQEGDTFTNASDGIWIFVNKKFDADNYDITVRYADQASKADVGIKSWLAPPGNTYETTDLWIDSPVNGYGMFRYGSWSDLLGGTVPQGNGDDPAIGQVNRIYARVRNFGAATAQNVVVHFDLTDPLGLGINGSNGFQTLGSVDQTAFPGLASIPAGGSVDVYIEWTPNVALTPAQIAAGTFNFHSCMRVRIDHLANETIFGNQDGDGTQENIDYFQAPATGRGVGGGAPNTTVIHLRNDSMVNKKYFNISYDRKLVPPGWEVSVNGGVFGMELAPNEVRAVPVKITPTSPMPAGSVAKVKVFASSFRLLSSDKDPKDKHPEFKQLGGVLVEGHAVHKTRIKCEAERRDGVVLFQGKIDIPGNAQLNERQMVVMYSGAVPGGRRGEWKFLARPTGLAHFDRNGAFHGQIRLAKFKYGTCMFAGTDTLSSAIAPVSPVK
ncbi:hypothetical protein LXA47_32810 [Massilia sp. P8910]|uniref:hypothetical protein n=1 Tax=Massilia antarctica TaxID=2765360 RepID=UPI001E4AFD0E|nr:hypothetical protein [Massilia antarctica]MCE3608350.1 hypothetical protein [Massilia antarctica]